MSKILVCGAGSIGIYLGVMLNIKGHEVSLFGKRKLKSIGNEIFINNEIYSVPKKIFFLPKDEIYDIIFITTKLYDLERMIKLINKNKLQAPILISIQNGLVDNSKFKDILGEQKLIILSVFEGFRLLENQLIMTPTQMGWKVEHSEEGKKVSKLLLDASILCKSEPNLDFYRAEKTIINCCLNALSAIEKMPFDKMFSTEKIRKRIDRIFYECYKIISKEYDLEEPEVIRNRMYRTWSNMNHYSSTCQDILSGRKTEINFLNGYIVQLAQKYSLNANENRKIIEDFKRIQK